MNKIDLIQTLRDTADITKAEAAAVVETLFNEMTHSTAVQDK